MYMSVCLNDFFYFVANSGNTYEEIEVINIPNAEQLPCTWVKEEVVKEINENRKVGIML